VRSGPLIAGIVLIVFGIGLLMYSYNQIQEFRSLGFLDQLGRTINPELQRQYDDYQNFQYVGMAFAVVGVGALIYGAAKK
jgi:hypothetical protein